MGKKCFLKAGAHIRIKNTFVNVVNKVVIDKKHKLNENRKYC